jgi:hypothetical protein
MAGDPIFDRSLHEKSITPTWKFLLLFCMFWKYRLIAPGVLVRR